MEEELSEIVGEQEKKEKDIAPIRIPEEHNKMLSDFKHAFTCYLSTKECPKCGQVVDFDNNEHEINCPICETKIIKE